MQRWEESEKRKAEERISEKREDPGAQKGRNVAKHCFSKCFVAPDGPKVALLKPRVRSHLGRWEINNCTPLWRSTCRSQNAQNTSCSERFWKLSCWTSARRCGAKDMAKAPHVRNIFGSWDEPKKRLKVKSLSQPQIIVIPCGGLLNGTHMFLWGLAYW